MNPAQSKELVARLRAAYPNPPMGDDTARLYDRMLSDLEYDQLDEIVDDLIATMMRLPTIARIRHSVVEPSIDLPTADDAWMLVSSRGSELPEIVKQAARRIGGTYNIQTSEDPELTRVRFVKIYEELRRRELDRAVTAGIRAQRMRIPAA